MPNMVQVEENNVVAASWGQAAYTAPVAPVKLRLTTTVGTATTPGTPVSGGSYADQAVTMNPPAAGAITNSNTPTYTNMPACTVAGVEQWDSAGAPVRRWFGPLASPKTTNAGDTFTFAAAGISASIS